MRILTGLYKFTKLPLSQKWLTFRIFYLAISISILIEIFPFRWFAIKLGKQMEETSYELSEKEAFIRFESAV